MPDVRNLLSEATSYTRVGPPAEALVEQDLLRAHRAASRARSRQAIRTLVPAGVVAAASGVLAVTMLGGGGTPAGTGTAAAPATSGTVATAPQHLATALTAYHGKQPVGFTIDKVPDGWKVQGLNANSLVIAPIGIKNRNPSNAVGKILITLANQGEATVERHGTSDLQVGDITATKFVFDTKENAAGEPTPGPNAPVGLLVPADHDRLLLFQMADGLNWGDATLADFAAGVHLTDDARAGQG